MKLDGRIPGDGELEGRIPMIFWNGDWFRICSHHFWDNYHGANLFCRKLGYDSGKPIRQRIRKAYRSKSVGFWVGKCQRNDRWPYCTGRCNKRKLGEFCKTGLFGGPSCNDGKYDLFHINCYGGSGVISSC